MRELLPRLEWGRVDIVLGVMGNSARDHDTCLRKPRTGAAGQPSLCSPQDARTERGCRYPNDCPTQMRGAFRCKPLFCHPTSIGPFFAARTTSDDRAISSVTAGVGITVMPRCYAQPGIAMPTLAGFDQRRRIVGHRPCRRETEPRQPIAPAGSPVPFGRRCLRCKRKRRFQLPSRPQLSTAASN